MKTLKMLATAALAMTASMALAQSDGEPMYNTTFYSDASYTQAVGGQRPSCTNQGVTYQGYGYATPYEETVLVGYCRDGRIQPD